jgi:hypothetical protein
MSVPIFPDNFLNKYLYDFKLSNVPNIRQIKTLLESLIRELESGKFDSLKEEEIKSRFVTNFFGDILNFNYGNADRWMLREEKKSLTDGTKSDAALGYFFKDKNSDDVRVVIEVKDSKTDLDLKQKREKNISAVEQGFSYAPKSGGNCNWVVITNIKEIRFYRAQDSSKFQVYLLEELKNEDKLKELLFLFHKDRLLKHNLKESSNTDTLFEKSKLKSETESDKLHIIDKIYFSLKRFEEFGFVNPDYLASIKPFNILDEYVWHYHDKMLFTINPEIYKLLSQIAIKDHTILFSNSLKEELIGKQLENMKEKLTWSFNFLNRCQIQSIQAIRDFKLEISRNKGVLGFSKKHIFGCDKNNAVNLNINLKISNNICDCIICTYRNLDFNKLIGKLKITESTPDSLSLEDAFGNFLVSSNNYRTSYYILNEIKQNAKKDPNKCVAYFLATLNMTFLYNQIQLSSLGDTEQIRTNIREIDLDKVLYNEMEFYVEKDVLEYLKKLRDDDMIHKVQDNVEDLLEQINNLKKLIDGGGSQSGPNYAKNLIINYQSCLLHLYHNFIFYFKFNKFKKINERTLEALLISYNTPGYGIISFNDFLLTEFALNIQPSRLQKILKTHDHISVDQESVEKFLGKVMNFLNSYLKRIIGNDYSRNDILEIQLKNWGFMELHNSIFANMFTFLSRIELNRQQFYPLIKPLITFLELENNLPWYNLKEMEKFIVKNGNLFEPEDLESILNIAIKRDKMHNVKYEGLIKNIPRALLTHFPEYKYRNVTQIKRLLLNCARDDGSFANYRKVVYLAKVADESCRIVLCKTFSDYLENSFNDDFYRLLLVLEVFKYEQGNFFAQYVTIINRVKGFRHNLFGELKLTSWVFFDFISMVSNLGISRDIDHFKQLVNLNDFECWLLYPQNFDYQNFNTDWLIEVADYPAILNMFFGISQIELAIEERLLRDFHPVLAKIKYQFLTKNQLAKEGL